LSLGGRDGGETDRHRHRDPVTDRQRQRVRHIVTDRDRHRDPVRDRETETQRETTRGRG
jgi:hypothetical protein